MKALFIGGTGTISRAVTRLALERGWEITLLNRGTNPQAVPEGAESLIGDIHDEQSVRALLQGRSFDVVADFIVYTEAEIQRDIRLFSGLTAQYIFISTASAYQKPPNDAWITESTPLRNPYWQYSREKSVCERALEKAYRKDGFPMTIVRPSHTYDQKVPVALHGKQGSWQVLQRILEGRSVLIPGDGTSLWTLTHSRDFAKAFVGLMGHPKAIGEAFHITSDEQLTWDQALSATAAALGRELVPYHVASDFLVHCDPELAGPLLGDKSRSVIFDNSKVKRLVPEYVATIRFDQGVREAVAHLLAHPELQVPDPEFDQWCDRVIAAQEAGKEAFGGLSDADSI